MNARYMNTRKITEPSELAQLLKYGYWLYIDHEHDSAYIESLDGYHPVQYEIACAYVAPADPAMEMSK